MKNYRESKAPSMNLSGVREYNFPSTRIQGSNECIFCKSLTLSYKSVCRKCKYMVSHERLEYLEHRRQGQIELMEQEKKEKFKEKSSYANKRKRITNTIEEETIKDIFCMLCFLIIPSGLNNGCVICNECI